MDGHPQPALPSGVSGPLIVPPTHLGETTFPIGDTRLLTWHAMSQPSSHGDSYQHQLPGNYSSGPPYVPQNTGGFVPRPTPPQGPPHRYPPSARQVAGPVQTVHGQVIPQPAYQYNSDPRRILQRPVHDSKNARMIMPKSNGQCGLDRSYQPPLRSGSGHIISPTTVTSTAMPTLPSVITEKMNNSGRSNALITTGYNSDIAKKDYKAMQVLEKHLDFTGMVKALTRAKPIPAETPRVGALILPRPTLSPKKEALKAKPVVKSSRLVEIPDAKQKDLKVDPTPDSDSDISLEMSSDCEEEEEAKSPKLTRQVQCVNMSDPSSAPFHIDIRGNTELVPTSELLDLIKEVMEKQRKNGPLSNLPELSVNYISDNFQTFPLTGSNANESMSRNALFDGGTIVIVEKKC